MGWLDLFHYISFLIRYFTKLSATFSKTASRDDFVMLYLFVAYWFVAVYIQGPVIKLTPERGLAAFDNFGGDSRRMPIRGNAKHDCHCQCYRYKFCSYYILH